MDFNDLIKNLNIGEDYVDIILLILIIAAINSLSNSTNTYPYYAPCYFYECSKKRKKHHKQSIENAKAEVLDKNNNNNCNCENTFGFFNSYSSNSQSNLLFVILIVALLFLIEKLNINSDQNIENSEV